jgi:hypothetical protein
MATEGDHGLLGQLQADITAVFTVLLYSSVVCPNAGIYFVGLGLFGSTATILHDVVSSANNDEEQRQHGSGQVHNSKSEEL